MNKHKTIQSEQQTLPPEESIHHEEWYTEHVHLPIEALLHLIQNEVSSLRFSEGSLYQKQQDV